MGKGDKRSKKGKIVKGTFGVSRPRAKAKHSAPPAPAPEKKESAKVAPKAKAAKKAPAKKSPAKKTTTKAKEKADKES